MKRSINMNPWEPYIDTITTSYWRGDKPLAARVLNRLTASLKVGVQQGFVDKRLVNALYRLCDFYCFEREYAKGDALLLIILRVQKTVLGENHPDLVETLSRLARLRYVWECEGRTNVIYMLNESLQESA